VQKTPDAIAVVFEKNGLTYRQLNERSNQLDITLEAGCKRRSIGANESWTEALK
jgi:non-ribosomal peptide synthetase component F